MIICDIASRDQTVRHHIPIKPNLLLKAVVNSNRILTFNLMPLFMVICCCNATDVNNNLSS